MRCSQFNPFDLPAALAVLVILMAFLPPASLSPASFEQQGRAETKATSTEKPSPLPVPTEGKVRVAIVIGKDAEVLDFCGPLEVFDGATNKDGKPLFSPYIVAATMDPVTVSGGMKVVPNYTFKTAPAPKVIVIPAVNTRDASPEMYEWIRAASKSTDVTMSVCTGAFVLAKTGLLSGRRATTHHAGYFRFTGTFPDVQLKRGARFVEDGNLASAGGVSSGIDLALHIVERYAGREAAERVADRMEYQGKGWLDPGSNQAYSTMPPFDEKHPLCPLCLMDGDPAIKADYKGKTYHFCMPSEKEFFEAHTDVLERFLAEDAAQR